MTFNDELQLIDRAGMVILLKVLNGMNDLLHFFTKDLEEDFFFIREEIIDVGCSTAVGYGYFAHARGVVAFFPEKPSRRFQHLRFLETGFHSVSIHLDQTVSEGPCGVFH